MQAYCKRVYSLICINAIYSHDPGESSSTDCYKSPLRVPDKRSFFPSRRYAMNDDRYKRFLYRVRVKLSCYSLVITCSTAIAPCPSLSGRINQSNYTCIGCFDAETIVEKAIGQERVQGKRNRGHFPVRFINQIDGLTQIGYVAEIVRYTSIERIGKFGIILQTVYLYG